VFLGSYTVSVKYRASIEAPFLTNQTVPTKRGPSSVRRWIRNGFLIWTVISTLWLANSFRTQGVDDRTLQSSQTVTVKDGTETLEFLPASDSSKAALVFLCGSGVTALAYAPLPRPLANQGHAVFVVKLPYRFAPLESHKQAAVERVKRVIAQHPERSKWVLAGHSLGGALACRVVQADSHLVSAIVLIGTTHPKQADLSGLTLPVTKVYASNDGVAPRDKVLANKALLPAQTKWIEIAGGNHSQFGHYGHQLLDGRATIRRAAQQERTRSALLVALQTVLLEAPARTQK
jgi:predicted alpha/beta-hydrolase family hydrolase